MFGAAPTGPAGELLARLKRLPSLRGARFDVVGRGAPRAVVLGIAQVHPVHSGRYRRGQARAIGGIQSWILAVCEDLYAAFDVRTFGQEGLRSGDVNRSEVRLGSDFLADLARRVSQAGSGSAFLRRAAQEWRTSLTTGDIDEISSAALRLNALSVLQALHADVGVRAIEQEGAHDAVGQAITQLGAMIQKVETSGLYRNAMAKGGRGLTAEEVAAMRERNELVKQFNATISHPERDRAIFREVVEQVGDRPLAPFVLGTAHRKGMLQVARQYLPSELLYVWVTPPGLLPVWRRTWRLWLALAAAAILGVWWIS